MTLGCIGAHKRTTLFLFLTAFALSTLAGQEGKDLGVAGTPPAQQVSVESEVSRLKEQIAEGRKQLEQLRQAMVAQQALLERASQSLNEVQARNENAAKPGLPTLGQIASTTPMVPHAMLTPAMTFSQKPSQPAVPAASSNMCEENPGDFNSFPAFLRVGSTCITPVGFMDLTSVWRSTNPGSGIGSNFGSVPYSGTTAGALSEFRLSTQNSRIGLRADGKWKDTLFTGYLESDFLGPAPGNVAVTSNSDPLRLRVYWIDVKKDKFEILGGQSWSMLTPGRKGISPIPGDLFYTQNIDVNYHAGLTWSRDTQLRFVYHPSSSVAAGVSIEAPEQYIGGSAGGGTVVLPSALVTPYANELNNGNTTLNVPNLQPDYIAKIAFDPKMPSGHGLHFEIAGVARTFKSYNPLTKTSFTSSGWGGQANLNFELVKNFRFITNNYLSDGGGRWLFGQAPDVVVRGDGSLSAVHASSTLSGFEATINKFLLYAYYGGIYIGRNVQIDPANGKPVGYGYTGSGNGQNRSIQELSFGFNQTIWKDAKFGAINFMGQYAYIVRNPWFVASGTPSDAHTNVVFFNLRYTLPGSAPSLK